MSGESLLFLSAIFVFASIAMAVGVVIYDRRKHDTVREFSLSRHGKHSIFSLDARGYAVLFLLYLATAFAADIALEWLSAIALFCFFLSIVINRFCAPFLLRASSAKDEEQLPATATEPPSEPAAEEERRRRRLKLPPIRTPEPLTRVVPEILSLLATIVGWTAAIDLAVLLVMVLVETVIPHYIGILGVLA